MLRTSQKHLHILYIYESLLFKIKLEVIFDIITWFETHF